MLMSYVKITYEYLPDVVTDGRVFVAKIGATVAAATGFPVPKRVFYQKNIVHNLLKKNKHKMYVTIQKNIAVHRS